MSAIARPAGGSARIWIWSGILVLLIAACLVRFVLMRPALDEKMLEDASIDDLRKITAQHPNDARALYWLGFRLQRKKVKEEAADTLVRAANLAKDDEQIWVAAAGATNGAKGPAACFRIMDDYLKRHPDAKTMKAERDSLLVSLQRAADGFSGAKHYADGIKYYHLWLDEDPNNANAKQGLANALKGQAEKNGPK